MKKQILFFSLIFLAFLLRGQDFKTWRVGSINAIHFNQQAEDLEPYDKYANFSTGLQLGHRFNQRWEMEIGIGLSTKKIHSFFPSCLVCHVIGGTFITNPSPRGRVDNNAIALSFMDELKYIDLSVMGNYAFHKSDLINLFASAGIRHSFLRSKAISESNSFKSSYRSVLISPVIGLGMEFHLTQYLQLRYQANYIMGLNTISKFPNASKSKILSMGLGIGFMF